MTADAARPVEGEAFRPVVVKICGLRSAAVARAALEAGADLLGFNFAPVSKRRVDPEVARLAIESCRAMDGGSATTPEGVVRPGWSGPLPPRGMAGVFVDQPLAEVAAIARRCALDAIQLSGEEDVAYCRAIAAETGLPVIKAVRLGRPDAAGRLEAYAGDGSVAVLLTDAPVPGAWGGTGQTWPWELAAPLARRMPVLLAGGLDAQNVGAAVAAVRPWGVDVATGVEAGGQTDAARVRVFVERVRGGAGVAGREPRSESV
jgi:phosphoribosylanthranilate isomerase